MILSQKGSEFVYELVIYSRDLNTDFLLNGYLIGTVKLTKNAGKSKWESRKTFIIFGE